MSGMIVITNPNNRNWFSFPVQIVSVVVVVADVVVAVVVVDVADLSCQRRYLSRCCCG